MACSPAHIHRNTVAPVLIEAAACHETSKSSSPRDLPKRSGQDSLALSIAMRENMKASKVKHIIDERLDILGASLGKAHPLQTLGLDHNELEIFLAKFRTNITIDPCHSHVLPSSFAKIVTSTTSAPQSDKTKTSFDAFETFQQVFVEKGLQGLDLELKHAFIGFVTDSRTTRPVLEKQAKIADLRYPFEWFPATRAKRRTIHLHVGPTNSGKTYHALKRLEQAGTGLYAGPLRLLAHEVYTRLNAKGKPCNLITGEEKRVIEGVKNAMISCTVEMTPINVDLEVAVIDEIQMIGSTERGWAWTQAFLGVKAKEVHLCGEERVVPLIQQLAALMGEKLQIHRYNRLSPLEVGNESLKGNLHALEKGDCVVLFSRVGIHAMKQEIEKKTGKRCAVVYGRLPPETRAQQARLFNDPDSGYDILIASDAIGMGLNLSIKRIIFETTQKRTRSGGLCALTISEIKQIGGRAGRYRTAHDDIKSSIPAVSGGSGEASAEAEPPAPRPNAGVVMSLDDVDLPVIRKAMESEDIPIISAGILPPAAVVHLFKSFFPPDTPFSFILLRLQEISRLNPLFHLCDINEQVTIADLIEPIRNLSVGDRMVICNAPVSRGVEGLPEILQALARRIANQGGGSLLDIEEFPLGVLDNPVTVEKAYLASLETLHTGLTLYLWLSYRFEGVFTSRPLAFHVKEMVEQNIDKVLSEMSYNPNARSARARKGIEELLEKLKAQYKERSMAKPGLPVLLSDAVAPSVG